VEELIVDSLPQLMTRTLDITTPAGDQEWWFRGQARASWELTASLYRSHGNVGDALTVEGRVLREFDNRSRGLSERPVTTSAWELYFLMQHYRIPTRLLDWSRNLLIATFFAVNDPEAWRNAADPPAVYVFDPKAWNNKVVGPAGLVGAGPSGIFNDFSDGLMTGYAPRFSGTPLGPLQRHALCIGGPELAPRISAQRGTFMVFGTQSPEGAESIDTQIPTLALPNGAITRLKLSGGKDLWQKSLSMVGIGPFSAFPDLDGLATELRSRYF
jgi:hypothetical protein